MRKTVLTLLMLLELICIAGCTKIPEQEPPDAVPLLSALPESAIFTAVTTEQTTTVITTTTITAFDMQYVPAFHGEPFCEINNSLPFFKEQERTTEAYESYPPLDALGRCGECMACIGQELMPAEKRGSIGMVRPSGWQLVRYDGLVDGNYLFNRCHLIAHMLTGQNANECNLITGTRYLNKEGMLPFEIMTADYIRETGNHVLYRVTPIFEVENLVASGVLMEALSVEDDGAGVRFNVYCYNVQPGITINYLNGNSRLDDEAEETSEPDIILLPDFSESDDVPDRNLPSEEQEQQPDYILNVKRKKFHDPSCPSVADINEHNKEAFIGDREALIEQGYQPCGRCKP